MLRYFVLLIAAGVVAGCAAPARIDQMTVVPPAGAMISENSPLHQSVEVGSITGGEATNPLWKSEVGNPEFQGALRKSLLVAGMLAPANGRYKLNAVLVGMDQPWIGFDFKVTSHVRYTVVEVASGKQVFDRAIDASYTATMSDSVLGVERLRLANEGAIKANIAILMDALTKEGGGWTSGGAPSSQIEVGRVVTALTQ